MNDTVNLLDQTLDDLDDMPEFKAYPPGAYRVLATMARKEIDNHGTCVELAFKIQEVVEMANPQDEPPKEGDTSAILFMLDNEYGVGNFKRLAKLFGEAFGLTINGEIVDQTTDTECVIITTLRKDKNDADKFHLNIKELQVL